MQNTAIEASVNAGSEQFPVVLVPRIELHVFCDNQQTGQILQVATTDRRMARAHVTMQLGGIAAACQVYQTQPTPNVLVVETHSGRDQLMAELAQLSEVCQANTKVVVLGHVNDVLLYRELIKAGISEYVVAPISAVSFIDLIAGLFVDPKASPLGRIVAFVGAKGGVGSSTIAHNIAWATSQKQGVDTIITDLDLAFGTASLNFNQDGSGGMLEALNQPDRLDSTLVERMMTKLGNKLSLLNGPGTVDRDFNIEGCRVRSVDQHRLFETEAQLNTGLDRDVSNCIDWRRPAASVLNIVRCAADQFGMRCRGLEPFLAEEWNCLLDDSGFV